MDLKDRLENILEKAGVGKTERAFLADILINNGVTVADWISVNDGLPNVNTSKSGYEDIKVLVCIKGYKKSTCRIYERACVRNKVVYRWKYMNDRICDEEITHWAYFPEPPKEETEDENHD